MDTSSPPTGRGGEEGREPQPGYFDRCSPYRIQIESSKECRVGCEYCYTLNSKTVRPMDSDEIRDVLRQAAEIGVRQVDWMGGDPLERDDWDDLMRYARFMGMINNLWTSGLNLAGPCVSKKVIDLTRGGFIVFHIDSLDPDILRGLRISFDETVLNEVLGGMETVLDAGKPPDLVINKLMVTSLHHGEDIRRTITYLRSRFNMNTSLMSLKPMGGAKGLLPCPDTVMEAFRLQDSSFPEPALFSFQDCSKHYCGTTFFVDLEGGVSPFYSLRRSVGSVRDEPLRRIVEENRESLFFSRLRDPDSIPRLCRSCRKGDRCWGCRANAYYFGEGFDSEDPLCFMEEESG